MGELRPLHWIGSSLDDLRDCPEEVRDVFGFALYQAQRGEKHVSAKPLKGFGGSGVLEVVENFDGNTFRAVYTVKFKGVVFVLHVFQKKSKTGRETPKHEIDLIKQRYANAMEVYEGL